MQRTQSGMTIIEVLVALAVVGVMLSVAVPSLSSYAESSQVSSDTSSLFNSLQLARSQSATRNSRISLCKIDPAAPTVCANGESWASGWIVFEDTDQDDVRDAGEQIFSTSMGMRPSSVVTTADFATVISFLPSGGVASNGTLTICVNGNIANTISINATGRPRIFESSCV